MKQKVKTWYLLNHPSDEYGKYINEKLTFGQLWKGLENGTDVYRMLGVSDSWIREIVFKELAEKLGVTYEEIYGTWLKEA